MTLGASSAIKPVHRGTARDVGEVDAQLTGPSTLRSPRLQLALQQVERALGAVDQDEASRPEGEDLARQLGPDRSRATGDHDGAVPDDLIDVDGMLGDDRAAKEVLHPDTADTIRVHAAVDEVRDRRHGADLELVRQRPLHRSPDGGA